MRLNTSSQTAARAAFALLLLPAAGEEEREVYSFCAAWKDSRERKSRKYRLARASWLRRPRRAVWVVVGFMGEERRERRERRRRG